MIIAVQILSFLFALFCGIHDVPAVNSFAYYGSSPKEQSKFHGANWKLKLCFALMASLIFYPHYWSMLYAFLLSGIEIWIVFDPVVARFRRTKKDFFYLSEGNFTDRLLMKVLGKNAGVYKFLFLIAVVIVLNILYYGNGS
jgi:hypothetical protein